MRAINQGLEDITVVLKKQIVSHVGTGAKKS